MKLRSFVAAVGLSLLVSVAPAFAALPTVNTFTVAATAESPVPVTAFTASDSDGTVVGYMITQTSTKPSSGDSRWISSAWTQYTTTSIGALTLYAWAKDNAGGVSNSRSATTNVVGGHVHPMSEVTGLTSALAGKANVGHDHDNVYQRKYARVAVVATSGGDYSDPAIAMSDFASWCGSPSATNPCLLKLMPGVYDIGTQVQIHTTPYMDIEGAGENATIVRGNVTGEYWPAVLLASNSEVRFLAVENVGTGTRGSAIYAGAAKLSHVTARSSGKSEWNVGIFIEDAPILTDVTAIGQGGQKSAGLFIAGYAAGPNLRGMGASASDASWFNYGIYISDAAGTTTISNLNATASGGGYNSGFYISAVNGPISIDVSTLSASGGRNSNFGFETNGQSTVVIRNSRILSGLYSGLGSFSIHNSSIQGQIWNDGTLNLALSEVDGSISNSSILRCFGVYDTSMNPVACP